MFSAIADPLIDIVIPVYNEERILPQSIAILDAFLAREFPFRTTVVIADNASTDSTQQVGDALAEQYPRVRYLRLPEKGRGRALKAAWLASEGDILCYMDVDLSTGLSALHPLVAPLASGHAAVSIGSRLMPHSRVTRGAKREFISRSYNYLIRAGFAAGFRDAQCGFKAIRADVARELLPKVQDNAWFLDTELLLLAEHEGLRIAELPVDWVDDPDTRVHIRSTATEDLKGLWRMRRAFWSERLPVRPGMKRAGAAQPKSLEHDRV